MTRGKRPPLRSAVVLTALVATSAAPVLAKNVYDPGQKGPFAVGYTSLMLMDSSRPGDYSRTDAIYHDKYASRPIPVCVWYPVDQATLSPSAPEAKYVMDPLYEGVDPNEVGSSYFENYGIDGAYQGPPVSSNGPFPLVMFSPGWGASCWQHASFGARLASHGFVVAIPYHFGDNSFGYEPADDIAVCAYNRPRDVSFVVDDLLARNLREGDLLFRALNPTQVAAGGWSLGGYAAMVLAGGDDSVCDTLGGAPDWTCGPSLPDPRIKAIVPLDGSGWALLFNELARITVPALGMGEEWSFLAATSPGFESWQARQHAAYQGHPAYRVDVANANHQSFSDLCENFQVF